MRHGKEIFPCAIGRLPCSLQFLAFIDGALSIVWLYTVNVHNFDKLSSGSENKRYLTKMNSVFLANKIVTYTGSGVLSTLS